MRVWGRRPQRVQGRALAFLLTLLPAFAAAAPCGVAVIPLDGAISSLHPLLTHSVSDAAIFTQLFRPLLWFDHDGAIDFADSEAEAIEVSADRMMFRIALKPWRWSDGRPVTADDLVYGFKLIRELGAAYFNAGVGGMPGLVASVRAEAPLTLAVRTTRPVNPDWFEGLGLANLVALPRHAWGGVPLAVQQVRQADPEFLSVVDGPFRLARLAPGRFVALAPNPAWRGHPVGVDRLLVQFVTGTQSLTMLRAGELDLANLPVSLLAVADRLAGFRRVVLRDDQSLQYLAYNFANPATAFFRELGVRQAIADAVDQAGLIAIVDHGQAAPVHGPVPDAMAGFSSSAARAGHWATGFDPARARALLTAAGFRLGADGVLQRRGVRLEWTDLVPAGAEAVLLTGQVVQAELAAVGIRMALRPMELNQFIETTYNHPLDWQSVSGVTGIGLYPALDDFGSTSSVNAGHFADAAVDALLDRLSREPGRAALFTLADRLAGEQPLLFLPTPRTMLLVAPGLEGVSEAFQTDYFFKLEYLRLVGGRRCGSG